MQNNKHVIFNGNDRALIKQLVELERAESNMFVNVILCFQTLMINKAGPRLGQSGRLT